jgi:hypothetical protein
MKITHAKSTVFGRKWDQRHRRQLGIGIACEPWSSLVVCRRRLPKVSRDRMSQAVYFAEPLHLLREMAVKFAAWQLRP